MNADYVLLNQDRNETNVGNKNNNRLVRVNSKKSNVNQT